MAGAPVPPRKRTYFSSTADEAITIVWCYGRSDTSPMKTPAPREKKATVLGAFLVRGAIILRQPDAGTGERVTV